MKIIKKFLIAILIIVAVCAVAVLIVKEYAPDYYNANLIPALKQTFAAGKLLIASGGGLR